MTDIALAEGVNLRVDRVRAATVRHALDVPLQFGRWRITHREFAVVRVDTVDGASGFSYGLTRDGPVAAIIARSIAPVYEGADVAHPSALFRQCRATAHAVLSSGAGLRAISLVDVALWDALARQRQQSIVDLLGGRPTSRPVTSIIGYPAVMTADQVHEEVLGLMSQGWRQFKAPVAPERELTIARLEAARAAAPGGWVGLDGNYSLHDIDDVVALEARVRDLNLGWIEDPLPQGDAAAMARLRERIGTPIAAGDDQGGAYFPDALLAARAIDVLRVDICANGGLTGLATVVEKAKASGIPISPHMFAHFHTRALDGLGVESYSGEWGIPGAGVHPMDDALEQPVVVDGVMKPLAQEVGFGRVVSRRWIAEQSVDDPGGALDRLSDDVCVN